MTTESTCVPSDDVDPRDPGGRRLDDVDDLHLVRTPDGWRILSAPWCPV
jgi:hypothetical protein